MKKPAAATQLRQLAERYFTPRVFSVWRAGAGNLRPYDGSDVETLLNHANAAMERAK